MQRDKASTTINNWLINISSIIASTLSQLILPLLRLFDMITRVVKFRNPKTFLQIALRFYCWKITKYSLGFLGSSGFGENKNALFTKHTGNFRICNTNYSRCNFWAFQICFRIEFKIIWSPWNFPFPEETNLLSIIYFPQISFDSSYFLQFQSIKIREKWYTII